MKHKCKAPVFDILLVLTDDGSQALVRCIFCGELHILDSIEREQWNAHIDNNEQGL